jgi:hypothetical protein
MANPVLIAISILISIIAVFLIIIYLINRKFRSYPYYFNIIFILVIAVDNIIRLIPGEIDSKQKETIGCKIQAFTLTLFDKLMLILMTIYSIFAYLENFQNFFYKPNEKIIFIISTSGSFVLSLILAFIFFFQGIEKSEYCYVESNTLKNIVDSSITGLLLLISLFCLISLLINIKQIKQERENDPENEQGKEQVDFYLVRFIGALIMNLLTFGYVIILINNLITFNKDFIKDLIYMLLSLSVELFYTIKIELINQVKKMVTCNKGEEESETKGLLSSENMNEEGDIDVQG